MDPVGKFLKTFADMPITLDGKVIGYVPQHCTSEMFEQGIRKLKVENSDYAHLEVALVGPNSGTPFLLS